LNRLISRKPEPPESLPLNLGMQDVEAGKETLRWRFAIPVFAILKVHAHQHTARPEVHAEQDIGQDVIPDRHA
jgi:hypothetical protein